MGWVFFIRFINEQVFKQANSLFIYGKLLTLFIVQLFILFALDGKWFWVVFRAKTYRLTHHEGMAHIYGNVLVNVNRIKNHKIQRTHAQSHSVLSLVFDFQNWSLNYYWSNSVLQINGLFWHNWFMWAIHSHCSISLITQLSKPLTCYAFEIASIMFNSPITEKVWLFFKIHFFFVKWTI